MSDYNDGAELFFVTRGGMIKRSSLSNYDVRNKRIAACGLSDGDEILSVTLQKGESDWLVVTKNGMAVRFHSSDVSSMGRSAKGVKAVALEKGDSIVMASPIGEQDDLALFTDLGYAKLTKAYQFEAQRRGGKGVKVVTFSKSTGTYVAAAFIVSEPCGIVATLKSGDNVELSSEQLDRGPRTGKGTAAVMVVLDNVVISAGKYFLT